MTLDTIVAVATPPGVGGISVVRLSGPDALAIATPHLSDLRPPTSDLRPHLSPRHATYCRFDDLDDVVATYYPRGYTGEPTVEISCHGSLYVQQALLQALVDSGARMAEAGEFTLRAFRNGRLNLSQAEAVDDLIDAVTPTQHRLAVSQLRGGYADELKALRQQLLDLTSLLELELDFSQEDVEFADRSRLSQLVETLTLRIDRLRATFRQGNALKRGIPVAIVGRPNAGKSTLLNALLRDHRALVSDIPGTTRDTIEETFVVDGIAFRLIDTAGLRHSDDPLESMGIQRTIAAVSQADIVLFVYDATRPHSEALADLQQLQDRIPLKDKHLFLVANKIDLTAPGGSAAGKDLTAPGGSAAGTILLSAKQGTGIDRLTRALTEAAGANRTDDVIVSNERHYEELGRVGQALLHVAQGLTDGLPADLVAVDLRDALYHLGAITGEVANDEILTNIFSRFCIGK